MDKQKCILIVEDEKNIVDILRFNLQREGYDTREAYDGADGLDKARSENPDLILLDVMLPKMNGFDVCQKLREEGNNVPVIILTAREEEADKVLGLEIGADDYLPKPFAVPELLARVRAMLRRTGSYTGDILHIGNVTLSCTTYELSSEHGSFRLNNKEFQLMEHFMRNPGVVYSSDDLMEKFWGWDSEAEINVVWTNIGYLRRKLRELQATAEIRSIRGVGYCLEEKPC